MKIADVQTALALTLTSRQIFDILCPYISFITIFYIIYYISIIYIYIYIYIMFCSMFLLFNI